MLICCGIIRIFWKNGRIHIKFRPYRYRKKLLDTEKLKKEHETVKELQICRENLSVMMSEMEQLCANVTHPQKEIFEENIEIEMNSLQTNK